MKHDTNNSASDSGPTSSKEAAKARKNYDRALDPAVADKALTDEEYLRRQAERAKLAIAHTAASVKDVAMAGAKSIDPLKIVKQHPWSAVGITTVLGFVGALWFNPSRNTWLRKRMGQLEKRVDRQMKRAEALAGISDKKETQKAAGAGIFASAGLMAAREGWKFLQPMVMEKLSTLIPQPPAEHGGNGRHAPDHEEMAAGARETPPTV